MPIPIWSGIYLCNCEKGKKSYSHSSTTTVEPLALFNLSAVFRILDSNKQRREKDNQRVGRIVGTHSRRDSESKSSDDEVQRIDVRNVFKKNKTRKIQKHVPVARATLGKMLLQIMNSEMRESLEWLKESLGDAIEDYEIGNNEGIPLVPVMDYAETAMENVEFQRLLKAFGVCPPSNEQEIYWRIPSSLTLDLLANYVNLIEQALENTLTVEEELPEQSPTRIESSDDEDVFDKIRTITKANDEERELVSENNGETFVEKDRYDENQAVEFNTVEEELSEQSPTRIESSDDENVFDKIRRTTKATNKKRESISENNEETFVEKDTQEKNYAVEFSVSEFALEENDENVNNVSFSRTHKNVFDSDSETETEKRPRFNSSSDEEKPAAKKSRIIDSDSD
ncbi:hypothetical protein ABEB36_005180 [Hypothenemus hampei]|uniref:Timeless C-terminal domain-containing protein n=1 Tax=Hypothenemus hampei TaxID=57062 RepID=A0ABD1EXB5_HYPHA